MNFWQAMLLGVLQGATELFPVSSLGHAVLFPPALGWHYDERDPRFVPFLVLLHLGTATALLVLYRQEWIGIVRGFFRAAVRGRIETPQERLAMLLMTATIPAGVLGVLFETRLKALFANPRMAAAFLIANAAILFAAELFRRRDERRRKVAGEAREEQESAYGRPERLSFLVALAIGASQGLALLPGISRSGVTLAAGLLAGLRHDEAARFSFLMATPIIAAAGLAEVPALFAVGVPLGTYLLAAVLAGLAAYASAAFLIRYFHTGRLDPYAAYCLVVGVAALLFIH